MCLYLTGRAICVSPKDVVKNKELGRPKPIAKPSLPNYSSAAVAGPSTVVPRDSGNDQDTAIFLPSQPTDTVERSSDPRVFRQFGAAKRKATRPQRLDVGAGKVFLDMEAVEQAACDEEASEYDIDVDDDDDDDIGVNDVDERRRDAWNGGRGNWSQETESKRTKKCVTVIPKRKNRIEYEDDDDYDGGMESSQNIPGLIDDTPIPDSPEEDAARAHMIEQSKRDYFQTIPDSSRVNQALRSSISSILKKQQQQDPSAVPFKKDPSAVPFKKEPSAVPPNQLEAAIEQARHQMPRTDSCEAIHGSPSIPMRCTPFDPDEVYISDDPDTAQELKDQFLHHPPPQELTK